MVLPLTNMPRYDYTCTKCNKELEIKHGFNEKPPVCGCGGSLTKVFAPVMITFNGKGFYSTDK